MGGWWPFKRKGPEEQGQEVIEYELGGDDQASQTMEDRSHIEEKTYQNALSLLSSPHLGKPDAGEIVPTTEVAPDSSPESSLDSSPESSGESQSETSLTTPSEPASTNSDDVTDDESNWLHHTDGYWYRKDGAGGFEATAYIREPDGTFAPFSA